MFAKLKQKIEKETGLGDLNADKFGLASESSTTGRKQRVVTSPTPSEDLSPSIHHAAHSTVDGVQKAARLSKRRTSSNSSELENKSKYQADERHSIPESRLSGSVMDLSADCSNTKEELLEMLVRRTKQVKSLDYKLAEMGTLLKEKNHTIEKLESALEKQQDVLCQRVQELNEQYSSSRAKMSENIAAAVRQKESELKERIESLERDLAKAHEELKSNQRGDAVSASASTASFTSIDSDPMMKRRIDDMENKNRDVTREIDRLKADNERLEKQLKESKDSFAQMLLQNSQEDWLEKQIENETTLSALDSQLQKLKAELQQKENEKTSLVRQLSDKISELSETKKSTSKYEEKLSSAESSQKELQNTLTSCQQQISQLEKDKLEAERKKEELNSLCDSYKAELNDTRRSLEEKLTNHEQTIQELNDLVEMKLNEHTDLENKITQLESEKTSSTAAAGKVEELTSNVGKLEDQLQDKNRVSCRERYNALECRTHSIIKKLEQRLNDMKKLMQRELKVTAPSSPDPSIPGGVPGGAARVLHVKDSNGLRPNASSNMLISGNDIGETSKMHPSESYPNLQNALPSESPAATLPVSYSVTELHRSAAPYSNSGPLHNDDTSLSDIETNSGLCMSVRPEFLTNQRLTAGNNSASPFYNNDRTMMNAGESVRALTGDEIAELMSDKNEATSGIKSKDYVLSRDLNLKYLRHVILKFLLSRETEAIHLLRALSTLLEFTEEEQKLLRDTLEWKMSWFGSRPQIPDRGQTAKIIPPTAF